MTPSFKKHGKGYMVFMYGEHVGQIERVRHVCEGTVIRGGWKPSNEHAVLDTERSRKLAARALWDARRALLNARAMGG